MNVSTLRLCSDKELVNYLRSDDSEVVRLLCDRMERIMEDYIDPEDYACLECSDERVRADGFEETLDAVFEAVEEAIQAHQEKDWDAVEKALTSAQAAMT